MRYWFNEARNELFALEIPPPDAGDCIEVAEADFREYEAAVKASRAEPAPEPAAPEPATVDMEKLARIWRRMQDKRDELSAEYKAADLLIQQQQDQVGAVMLDAMNKLKGTSLKTAAGTVEKKTQMQVSGKDWDAIYRFIAENDAWELLHKRIGTKFVEDWAKAHDGALPPGVSVFSKFVVSVKKPGAKEPPKTEE